MFLRFFNNRICTRPTPPLCFVTGGPAFVAGFARNLHLGVLPPRCGSRKGGVGG